MSDTTPSPTPRARLSASSATARFATVPFATVPAALLRVGDLIHRPRPGGAGGYVLVARASVVDELVHLMLYDTDHPHGHPATVPPGQRVVLACRDLIEPDDGLTAWTDVRWRRAHRRGAAIALLDQIRARSVGHPPAVVPGDTVGDEIDRLRSRDPRPRVLPADELATLLADATLNPVELDVASAAVRAILGLFVRVKEVEQREGEWNGADVVAVLSEWFDSVGLAPDGSVADLTGRVVTTAQTTGCAAAVPAGATSAGATSAGGEHPGGYAVVDLDRVAELVRAGGVDCEIDTPAGGVAVLLAGRPWTEPVWAFPWLVQLGPGRFRWDAPATGSLRDLRIGPDTPDWTRAVLLRELGATSEEQIADAVLTRARRAPAESLPDRHDREDHAGPGGDGGGGSDGAIG